MHRKPAAAEESTAAAKTCRIWDSRDLSGAWLKKTNQPGEKTQTAKKGESEYDILSGYKTPCYAVTRRS